MLNRNWASFLSQMADVMPRRDLIRSVGQRAVFLVRVSFSLAVETARVIAFDLLQLDFEWSHTLICSNRSCLLLAGRERKVGRGKVGGVALLSA